MIDLRARLIALRGEHRALDDSMAAGIGDAVDQLEAARRKRHKLRLRDEIARIETMLIPDIIA